MASTELHRVARGESSANEDLRSCAEEILYLLGVHGVDILFLNPGTDSAPLQEAGVALTERGVAIPRIIVCTFEGVALAAAHGHWQASRRLQAVFVHVDVGTQNLGAMVHNVLRDRGGALVLAGKTPYAEDADSPGARDSFIHWQQDVPDQAGIVRSYAKWTRELTRSEDTARVIGRAAQVACGGIPGLAYLTLSRDILMEPAAAARLRRTAGFARPVAPAAPEAAIDDLAAQLARAERPLLLTSRSGRAPGAPAALRRLAELAAIPVFGRAEAVNLVTTSPMSVRSARQGADLLRAADLVLIVDTDVPWIPRNIQPSPDAVIVQIDRDPVKADMPLWTFPVGLSLTAEPALALHQLADALESRHGDESGRWSRRRDELAPAIAQATNSVRAAAAAPGVAPTDIRAVFTAINEAIDGSCLIVDEAVSNTGRMSELIDRPEAETMFSAGGPGLGWAPGASVGIKLARPDRDVLVVIGDGAFMFGVPTAALTLANEARAPVVMLVLNNSGYRASRLPVGALYPEGSAVAADHPVWTRFRRAPDFAALAEACGACGWRTEGAEGLGDALADAFAATRDGVSAIIDVRVDQ